MAQHHNTRDYGLRACAGLSMLSALLMTLMSIYVFVARVEDLSSSQFPKAGLISNITKPNYENNEPSDDKEYRSTLRQLNSLWIKNRPVLASSSMLAILAGILQIIFCGLVILSDSKAMQLYIRKWILIHFILLIVLFIILLNTIILSESKSDEGKSWDELTSNLRNYLKDKRPLNDYGELFRTLGAGPPLIYIGVSINLCFIVIVMGATLCLMRTKQGDYESYE